MGPTSVALAALAALLLLAACGDDTAATTTTARVEASTTTTAAGAPAPETSPSTEPASDRLPGTEDADQVIEVTVAGGAVEGGGRHAVAVGETVALVVRADTEDEIHVHGYELLADVGPDRPAVISFVADLAGVWEVELHDARLPLVELEVS
jgi:hypothetical protein